jgi:hypothetical protein
MKSIDSQEIPRKNMPRGFGKKWIVVSCGSSQ